MTRLVPLTGILAVAAIVASFAIAGETPDTDDSLQEVVSFYTENDSDQVAAGILLALAAFFFLCFLTVLWGALRQAEGANRGASALSFAGGVVYAVGILLFAGLSFAIGDAADDISPEAIQTLHVLNNDFFLPVAVGNLTFLIGSGIAVLRTAVFPKWLGWLAIAGAVFQFTPLWFVPLLTLGLWVIIVSVLLSRRAEAA